MCAAVKGDPYMVERTLESVPDGLSSLPLRALPIPCRSCGYIGRMYWYPSCGKDIVVGERREKTPNNSLLKSHTRTRTHTRTHTHACTHKKSLSRCALRYPVYNKYKSVREVYISSENGPRVNDPPAASLPRFPIDLNGLRSGPYRLL